MFLFGLVLALASIGRCVFALVWVAAVAGAIGGFPPAVNAVDGFGRASISEWMLLFFQGVVALASRGYLAWYAFAGHPQLRATPAPAQARRIVISYGVAILAVVPLIEWGASRYT